MTRISAADSLFAGQNDAKYDDWQRSRQKGYERGGPSCQSSGQLAIHLVNGVAYPETEQQGSDDSQKNYCELVHFGCPCTDYVRNEL